MAQGEDKDGDDAALRARLAQLSSALEKTRQGTAQPSDATDAASTSQSIGTAANLGFRVLVEFVTAVVLGPVIGWQIDAWLKTGPVFLVIFLFLGMAAGFLNVYRIGVGSRGSKRGPN
jgi:ATP synthase protein I